MKNKLFKAVLSITFGCVLIMGNTGCKKLSDFGDINTRKDASAVPVTSYLLTNVESQLGTFMTAGITPSLFTQMFVETQYTDVSLYQIPQVNFGGIYSGPLQDLQTIIDLNTDPATRGSVSVTTSGSSGNQLAIARILKAYIFWTVTDRWGDVPYSEALKGAKFLTPKYDKQEDIYKDLLKELRESIAAFDGGTNAKGDIFYNGNPANWKKVANTLRMLISLRMSKNFPNPGEFAATEFSAAALDANGSITTNADNLTQTYDGATALTTNPWYNTLNGRKDYAFSLTFSNILSNLSDTRRTAFATSGTAFPYGLIRNDAVTFDNSVGTNPARPFNLKTQTTSVVIIPAAYTLLSMAEAVQRGWVAIPGQTAQSLYDAGVTASFDQWGATGVAAYLAGNANFTTGAGGGTGIGTNAFGSIVGSDALTPTQLSRIHLQRFIASYGDGIQAWSSWRRTGVPNLRPSVFGSNTPKEIPRRYTYGLGEYANNPASVAAAAGRLAGGDIASGRVWWDKP